MNTTTVKAILLSATCCSIFFTACKKEDDHRSHIEPAVEKIPFSGSYSWDFEIPGMGSQKSTHVFYPDSIQYIMSGSAYTMQYSQVLESYDPQEKRCITIGKGGSIPKDGIYFVMFFKDITDSTITIYKHECASGKEEAKNFGYPADNATADYGWNIYKKD